jgi:hypothetical protein
MPVYIIAYDLHREPSTAYDRLIDALEGAGAWHAQESLWLLNSPYSARQNYDWFKQFMHRGDELMVSEMVYSNTWVTIQSTTYACFQWINALAGRQGSAP